MKQETRTQDLWVSEDGREFLTKDECEKYEKETLGRFKNIKYFRVYHSPDLTEGRGMYGLTFIAVETQWGGYCAEPFAMDWCFKTFGKCVAYVQGCSPTDNWRLSECTEEDWKNRKSRKAQVGDYKYDSKEVFLSNGTAIEGFPEPESLKSIQ